MKKQMLLLVLALVMVGMFGCGAKETEAPQKPPMVEESVAEEVPEEVPEEETEPETEAELLPEELQNQEYAREADEDAEEENAAFEHNPEIFEEVSIELTTYPIIKYTIMGEQRQLDYTMYETMYPYNMISKAEFAIGYTTGDVTGDGLDDLIVSIYAVGNTLAETLQDTYVYTVDADINDLNEILYVSCHGGEQFAPGFPNVIDAAPSENGTLELNLCAEKGNDGQFPPTTTVELVYQDGMWSVK